MAEKMNVTGRVIHYIRTHIEDGSWVVGDKIPSENELCETLNVSRVSVRRALQRFTTLGILESVHGKGSFVLSDDLSTLGAGTVPNNLQSVDEVLHMLEFRSMIEPEICAAAARNATPELVQQLDEALERMRASMKDSVTFVQNDIKFHLALCNATKNPIAISVMSDVFGKRAESYYSLNSAVGYYGGIYYHALILDAVKKHDSKHARALMYEHLQRGMEELDLDIQESGGKPSAVVSEIPGRKN